MANAKGVIGWKWAVIAAVALIVGLLGAAAASSAINLPAAEPLSRMVPTLAEPAFTQPQLNLEEPMPTQTPTLLPFEQAMAIEVVIPTLEPAPPPTEESTPGKAQEVLETKAPSPTASPIPLPSPTPLPTSSSAPRLGSISGRVILKGLPAGNGFTLFLEDSQQKPAAKIRPGPDGSFTFSNLPPSPQGYSVVFEKTSTDGFDIKEVISWGWLGPIPLGEGQDVILPDFELGYLGFEHSHPDPHAALPAASVSPANPLVFQWSVYPGGAEYWVDLARGDEQVLIWQSPLVSSASATFQGTLHDGTLIQPGEYWWGIGAQRELGGYPFTIYGYLVKLVLEG